MSPDAAATTCAEARLLACCPADVQVTVHQAVTIAGWPLGEVLQA
jgi:hypothetical protein